MSFEDMHRRARRLACALMAACLLALTAAGHAALVPELTLDSPSPDPFSGFGSSLDISGDFLVVGAPFESDAAQEALHVGAVYVYQRQIGQWNPPEKLVASDGDNEDLFGHAVAIDGLRLVVGAPFESDPDAGQLYRGAAYVFERALFGWNQTARLDAGLATAAFASFGQAVAVDGDLIAIGAPGDGDDPGSVFVFEYDGSTWTSTRLDGSAPGDRFGSDLALTGDHLSVAERGGRSWRAYTKGSQSWVETSQQFDSALGFASALGGNEARVAIGAPGDDVTVAGQVQFFALEGASWQLEEVKAPATLGAGDRFGTAVALDGHFALIGAPSADAGATPESGLAYLYSRAPGGDWQLRSTLDGNAASTGQRLGDAVAIDGTVQAIGAPGYSGIEAEDGRVFVYRMTRAARFSVSPRLGCAPLQVTFTDKSAGDITSRQWDVDGDGVADYTNPGPSFTHTYPAAGTYTATLTVDGGVGLPDSDELDIEVGSGASADFTATPLTGTAPLQVIFTDLSTGPITERRWDLDGDGNVDIFGNQTTVSYTYLSTGTFSPKLETISPCGSSVKERIDYITVSPSLDPTILNPSFEANGTSIVGVGAINQGNAVDHWTFLHPGKSGRNAKNMGHPFYNNGNGGDGQVAAYLKDAVITQTISGFKADTTYRLTFRVNGRANQGHPNIKVRLGGTQILDEEIFPVESAGSFTQPFRELRVDVKPGAGTHTLEIEQDRNIFAGLLIDYVDIKEAPIQNPSFEDDGTSAAGLGLVSQGNTISHWQYSDPTRAGRNPMVNTNPPAYPFYNNGQVQFGNVAGFLKEAIFSQMVTGFEAGVTYRLTFHVNARALQANPNIKVRLNGNQVLDQVIQPVDSLGVFNTAFDVVTVDVLSPGTGSFLLEIEQDRHIFASLLIDYVDIQPLP